MCNIYFGGLQSKRHGLSLYSGLSGVLAPVLDMGDDIVGIDTLDTKAVSKKKTVISWRSRNT